MARVRAWSWWLGWTLLLVGCAASMRGVPREKIELPEGASEYTTDAQDAEGLSTPEAKRLLDEIRAALRERGVKEPRVDRALSRAATMVLHQVFEGVPIDSSTIETAARRQGFGGITVAGTTFENGTNDWRDLLDKTPSNIPLNRIGLAMSPSGRVVAVVLGEVELHFEPIARFLEPGSTVTLKGEIERSYSSSAVFLTKPDGTVEETPMTARKLAFSKVLDQPGKYKLEVMAHGPRGPWPITNIPLFVGVAERETLYSQPITEVSAEQAEARILELVNQAREAAKLPRVERDEELRAIALGHSEDMADHDFVAHVSPSTGSPEDRVRRAGVRVAQSGENIGLAKTPEAVHEGLMESPGHRGLILGPSFTHVGIAVVKGDAGLYVTELFARRPRPNALPRSASQVEQAILALRASKGLSNPKLDALYRKGAAVGAALYAADSEERTAASKATASLIQKELRRTAKFCTLALELTELTQLEQVPPLLRPGVARLGVGAEPAKDAHGDWLATVIVLEGACQ